VNLNDSSPEDRRRQGVFAALPRVLAVCVAASVVIGFGDGSAGWKGALEFLVESICGALTGLAAARWIVPPSWFDQPWRVAPLIAALVTPPVAAIVVIRQVLTHQGSASWSVVLGVLPSVFVVSLVLSALSLLVRRQPAQTHAAPQDAPPPKFLARLPDKLRGGEIYAVEAEDHYLRLHTSLGQDLILMRLGDAIVELEGLEGAQTHRSWWVAKAAIASAERQDGRATLTLKDGAEVPVSRGFARTLRAAGWF
jgi:DNA-binding LytR/AlgR family response regulator